MRINSYSALKGTIAIIILALSVTMLCVSCSPEQADNEKAYHKAENNLKGNSRFLSEIEKEKYKKTDPPSTDPVFRWDFSTTKNLYTYIYEQEIQSKTDMGSLGGKSADMEQEMSAKGVLLVKSQGDSTAELVLRDMKMKMKMDIGKDEPKTMEQEMPPFVMQGMKEDGTGPFGNSSQDMLLRMLFPLPPKPIKIGESVDVPAQMPFNAMGSLLQVTGHSRITLTRYVKTGGRTCAQLDVDTDISHLKVPTELKGEYKCSSKGTSVFYFDVASRSFVAGTIALIMQLSIDAPMPQMKISGENTPDMPKRSKMSMMSDNLIRVKLKE
ncbi:hypothetical protein QUF80_23440 [Desulfococcaceae bacterium HSG8]|nr:hypothetical protein [Desulfococcaceae bacterium HSG8]